MRPLEGKLALVTGASRGIGAATAEALAAAGAHVLLTARTEGALVEVEDRIHATGGTATIAPLDLVDSEAIERLAQAVAGRWAKLDILVLNAAVLGDLTPVAHIQAKDFDTLFAVNVGASLRLISAFDPLLRAAPAGRLIAVTSSVGARPRAYWGLYGASKAALENLVTAYAEEVSNLGNVRAAILDPGATRTAMRAKAYPGEEPETLKPPEAVADRIVSLLDEPFPTSPRRVEV